MIINIIIKILSIQKAKNSSKCVNWVNNLLPTEALQSLNLLVKAAINILIYDNTISL